MFELIQEWLWGPPFWDSAPNLWGIVGIALMIICLFKFFSKRWVSTEPNEWLLVIRNGQLHKAGIGMTFYLGLTDSYVKFPSKVEKLEFKAMNVTRQMQGVAITGFAFWSVFREKDGPFRCYKYLQSDNANRNVGALCESVLRNLIANSTLEDVLKSREHIKSSVRQQLQEQFKGWGIWLETIEITDVKICSKKVFEDLQAEFRQKTKLAAQHKELTSNEQIKRQSLNYQLKVAEANQLNETRKDQLKHEEQLKRDQMKAEYERRKNQVEIEKLKRQTNFELEQLRNDHQAAIQRVKNQQMLQQKRQDFQLQKERRQLELDKQMTGAALRKYEIDANERIYNKLKVSQVRVSQFEERHKLSLISILPQLNLTHTKQQ